MQQHGCKCYHREDFRVLLRKTLKVDACKFKTQLPMGTNFIRLNFSAEFSKYAEPDQHARKRTLERFSF
jgi:hypothetical protein